MLLLAGIINAIGVTLFIAPVQLYDSGISGTSILLSQLTPDYLSLSFFLILLNIPLLLFGFKRQGAVFSIYAIFTVCVYSVAAWLITDVLPVDENCKPLRKGILYGIDSRATEEIKYLEEYYGDRLDELWGDEELCSSDCMPKVLWIKNNEPEVYEKTYKFLTASSYITAKLTGKYVIDRYLAVSSFIPCYRPDLSIDDELARECYCRGDQLAEGHEATDVVGYVTAEAARETGLAEGTPVITGTDDSGAEAISAGVLQPGDLMVQLGSTCYIIYCSDQLIHDDRIWEEDSLIPGRYSIDGGTNAAGALTKWMRDTFFPDLVREQEAGGENAFTALTKLAAEVPAGAGGLDGPPVS